VITVEIGDRHLPTGPRILRGASADAKVAVVDPGGANRGLERPMDTIPGWTIISRADLVIDHDLGRAACRVRRND
jgi:hypothetical protein